MRKIRCENRSRGTISLGNGDIDMGDNSRTMQFCNIQQVNAMQYRTLPLSPKLPRRPEPIYRPRQTYNYLVMTNVKSIYKSKSPLHAWKLFNMLIMFAVWWWVFNYLVFFLTVCVLLLNKADIQYIYYVMLVCFQPHNIRIYIYTYTMSNAWFAIVHNKYIAHA